MNKKAFTLIELLITIAIIGLLWSMFVPGCKKARRELESKQKAQKELVLEKVETNTNKVMIIPIEFKKNAEFAENVVAQQTYQLTKLFSISNSTFYSFYIYGGYKVFVLNGSNVTCIIR